MVLGKLNNAIFIVKKIFNALVCQMCGNHSNTKYEIMKHHQKGHIILFILICRSWDFKPLSKKAKPTSVDSSLDKQKALKRNFGSQPFTRNQDDKINPTFKCDECSYMFISGPVLKCCTKMKHPNEKKSEALGILILDDYFF